MAIIAYNKVTFQPKVTHISPTIMGLSNGETNKKVRVDQTRLSLDDDPRSMGIVEQLQNGVTAPEQSSQEIASPFSGPHHLLDFMVWHLLSYQADTGTNHYKQQRKLDGEKHKHLCGILQHRKPTTHT